jgi:transposase InsO family protein
MEIFEYIELLYNRRRIHQSLEYQTPVKYGVSVGA